MGNCASCRSPGSAVPAQPSNVHVASESPPRHQLTPNEKIVEQICQAYNSHNPENLRQLIHPSCFIHFKSFEIEMRRDDFIHAHSLTFDSFPDMAWSWKSINEIRPGTVLLSGFGGHGTHTGKPYEFPPYPPIPATNKRVVDTDLNVTAMIKDGQMIDAFIDSFGKEVGPVGFYDQIGGVII